MDPSVNNPLPSSTKPDQSTIGLESQQDTAGHETNGEGRAESLYISSDRVGLTRESIRQSLDEYLSAFSDPTPIASLFERFKKQMQSPESSCHQTEVFRTEQLWIAALRDVLEDHNAKCPAAFRTEDGASYYMDEFGFTIKIAQSASGELGWQIFNKVVFSSAPSEIYGEYRDGCRREPIALGVFPIEDRDGFVALTAHEPEYVIGGDPEVQSVTAGARVSEIMRADIDAIEGIILSNSQISSSIFERRELSFLCRDKELTAQETLQVEQFFSRYLRLFCQLWVETGQLESFIQIGLPEKILTTPKFQAALDKINNNLVEIQKCFAFSERFARHFGRPAPRLPSEEERVAEIKDIVSPPIDVTTSTLGWFSNRLSLEFPDVVSKVLEDNDIFKRLIAVIDTQFCAGYAAAAIEAAGALAHDVRRFTQACNQSKYIALALPSLNLASKDMDRCVRTVMSANGPTFDPAVLEKNPEHARLLLELIKRHH